MQYDGGYVGMVDWLETMLNITAKTSTTVDRIQAKSDGQI